VLGLATMPALACGQGLGDPRVRAFREAYAQFIDSVSVQSGDVVFFMRGRAIHFADGRLLDASRPDRRENCDPVFYRYSPDPLTEPPVVPDEFPLACRDVLETLWGNDETEIRRQTRGVRFLNRRMIVNQILLAPLAAVERDLLQLAARSAPVAEWIASIEIAYSFIVRDIAASDAPSYHGWGMAFDLVPTSYEGRAVYWRWSRALDREGWQSIPMEGRWSPPHAAIEVFERHGFVWGGKWAYFDMIHFEYRPEIIIYNSLVQGR
jgi:hypothetical protein